MSVLSFSVHTLTINVENQLKSYHHLYLVRPSGPVRLDFIVPLGMLFTNVFQAVGAYTILFTDIYYNMRVNYISR